MKPWEKTAKTISQPAYMNGYTKRISEVALRGASGNNSTPD